jgi:hypothetical protein
MVTRMPIPELGHCRGTIPGDRSASSAQDGFPVSMFIGEFNRAIQRVNDPVHTPLAPFSSEFGFVWSKRNHKVGDRGRGFRRLGNSIGRSRSSGLQFDAGNASHRDDPYHRPH